MIPVHLRISGFLSYLDPVDLDFSRFDIACISGSNGAGKSSLLDAMTWVLFGQARRRDDALINNRARGAEVILDFDYENSHYRVQRAKQRDKAAILEFYIQAPDNTWKPLTERSVRETEARIQQTLRMDYDTFINASFFLQGNADNFAQQRPGDRKRILSSILGLEVWETYRAQAADRRKKLEIEVISLDNQISEIQSELDEEDTRKKRLSELDEQLSQLMELRSARETSLDMIKRLTVSLSEQRRLVDVLAGQLRAARQRQQERQDALQARCGEQETYQLMLASEETVRADYNRWQESRKELERWEQVAANFRQYETRRAAPVLAIETERARLSQERDTLLVQERAVRDANKRLPLLAGNLAEARRDVAQMADRMNQRPALEADLRALQAEQSDAQAENRRLRDEMNELKERITRLKEIEGAACPLCGQPMSTEERLALVAGLETDGRERGNRFRQNQERVKQCEARQQQLESDLAGFGPLEIDLRAEQRLVDQLEDQQAQIVAAQTAWETGGALRLKDITRMLETGEYALEAREELRRLDAALKDLGYDAAAHDAVRRMELDGRATEEQLRQIDSARAALGPLEREISRLQEQLVADTGEVTTQEAAWKAADDQYRADASSLPDLSQAERELFDLQEQENRARITLGGARQAVLVLEVQRKRQVGLRFRRGELANQVDQLKVLERAFSKDGVPALLIEQALPEIEALANEILDRLSSGTMSVRFETQKEYKDKSRDDRRETLDIIISDSSGPREYEMFSGGEAFRVNFAIRLALSRFLAQRAGARLQTLVIDEGFGSQDTEGRQRLIEAINSVRSDFAKILAITHMEELKDAFPVRIEVEKTVRGSIVRVAG